MISTPNIDDLVKAPLKFFPMIGYIRGKIGGGAILPADHPVLFITKGRGFEPQSAVCFEKVASGLQGRQGPVQDLVMK